MKNEDVIKASNLLNQRDKLKSFLRIESGDFYVVARKTVNYCESEVFINSRIAMHAVKEHLARVGALLKHMGVVIDEPPGSGCGEEI